MAAIAELLFERRQLLVAVRWVWRKKADAPDLPLQLRNGIERNRERTRAKCDDQFAAIIHAPSRIGDKYARLCRCQAGKFVICRQVRIDNPS